VGVALVGAFFVSCGRITWTQDVDAASKVVHRRDEQSETKVEDLMSMQNLDRIERLQKLERQGIFAVTLKNKMQPTNLNAVM